MREYDLTQEYDFTPEYDSTSEYAFTPDLGVPALLLVLFYIVMHL